jgi:hypothetical protein
MSTSLPEGGPKGVAVVIILPGSNEKATSEVLSVLMDERHIAL